MIRRNTQPSKVPMRVLALVEILSDEGVSDKNPIRPADARRYRGVGPDTLPYLEELGLIRLDDFDDLPTKIGNLLRRLGFKSRRDLVTAIAAGSFVLDRDTVLFRPSSEHRFHYVRNCGAQTFHQIRAWGGFNAPARDG